MIERGDRAGFSIESLAELRIGGQLLGQNLDGDVRSSRVSRRLVDLAHAAGADCGLDLVGTEATAARQGHGEPSAIRWPRVRTISRLPSSAGVAKIVSLKELVASTWNVLPARTT